jgi:hypothetical protein
MPSSVESVNRVPMTFPSRISLEARKNDEPPRSWIQAREGRFLD